MIPERRWPLSDRPGVCRRQHPSLASRSKDHARLAPSGGWRKLIAPFPWDLPLLLGETIHGERSPSVSGQIRGVRCRGSLGLDRKVRVCTNTNVALPVVLERALGPDWTNPTMNALRINAEVNHRLLWPPERAEVSRMAASSAFLVADVNATPGRRPLDLVEPRGDDVPCGFPSEAACARSLGERLLVERRNAGDFDVRHTPSPSGRPQAGRSAS